MLFWSEACHFILTTKEDEIHQNTGDTGWIETVSRKKDQNCGVVAMLQATAHGDDKEPEGCCHHLSGHRIFDDDDPHPIPRAIPISPHTQNLKVMAVLQMWAAMGEPKLQANAWPRLEASRIPSPGVSMALWSSSEAQQPPQKGSVFPDEVKDVGLVTTMKIRATLKQGRVGGTHYRLSTFHLQTQTLKCSKVQNC